MSNEIKSPWVFGAKNHRHNGVLVEGEEGKNLTVEQAIVKGGLDWLVELRDFNTSDTDKVAAPGWKQVVKVEEVLGKTPDTLVKAFRTLGVVQSRYKELQNRAAFLFFDRATLEGAAVIKAVGHLDFGRVVWAVAERPQSMELAPGDEVHEHLILTTSHDGTSAVKVMFAPYRTNTGTMLGVSQGRRMKSQVRVRHTKSINLKMDVLHNVLAAETDYFDRWRAALVGDVTQGKQGFKSRVVTPDEVTRVVNTLFPSRKKKDADGNDYEEVSGKAQKARDLILGRIAEQEKVRKEAYEKVQQEPIKGTTALDLFLGVSEYTAKDRKARNEGNNWVVSTFGSGADLRETAFGLIAGL
jgi:phage/plasmid-like protein (TIGR03299 family)